MKKNFDTEAFTEAMNEKVITITLRGDQWGPIMAMLMVASTQVPELASVFVAMITQFAKQIPEIMEQIGEKWPDVLDPDQK